MNKLQIMILESVSPEPNTGCWLWVGSMSGEYGKFGGQFSAHRISYFAFKGPIQGDLDHLCRTKSCVNPDHLEDVTRQTNLRRGSGFKITEEKAELIRELYATEQHSTRSLAMLFSVSKSQVHNIIKGSRR